MGGLQYDIEIDIHSRAALYYRAEKEMGIEQQILFRIASRTGMLEIEYVDYTVARNIKHTIEQWFDSLPQSKSSSFLTYSKKYSIHIPFIFKYLSAFFISFYFFTRYEMWVPDNATLLSTLFIATLLAFSLIFIVSGISHRLGRIVELAIDRAQPISYVKFNRGDELAISKLESSNRINAIRGIISFFLAFAASFTATWIASNLGIST